MNKIIYCNYKFTFTINETMLNIKINNIINNNSFEGSINKKNVESINKFYNLILNALNKTENFNIQINEESELIKIIIKYNSDFAYIEKIFKLNKKKQKIFELTFNNNVNLLICVGKNIDSNYGTYFRFFDNESHMMYNFIYCFKQSNFNIDIIYMINYNKIIINTLFVNNNYTLQEHHHVARFLKIYSMLNKHIINQIIFIKKPHENKINSDIIEILGGLTNYKSLKKIED